MDMFLKCNMCGTANSWTLPKNGQVSHLICQTCGTDIGKAECGCVTVKRPSDGNVLFSDIQQGLISTINRYSEAKMERRNAIDMGNKIHERILGNCKPSGKNVEYLWDFANMLTDSRKETKTPYQEVAAKIGDLVSKRQITYGDSFGKSGNVLRIMYPDGIKPDQYDDLMAITRILDKLFRLANGQTEDTYDDITGYGLLGSVRVRRQNDEFKYRC